MRQIQILIVDDEEGLRDIIEMILETEVNAEFHKAENGKLAEEYLLAHLEVDMIISDYNMPIKNGADLYNFNKSHRNLPMILLSGNSLEEYRAFDDFLITNKLNHFLNKPFDENQLIDAVKKIHHEMLLNS